MVLESADALVAALRESRLLPSRQLVELVASFGGRAPEPLEVGRQLITKGWLTPFQVNQVLQGRGRSLLMGPYLLLERIGSGGMGEVFKARHTRLQRLAAVKVIHARHLHTPTALKRFLREAEAAARLSHPNIVTVYDAGQAAATAERFAGGVVKVLDMGLVRLDADRLQQADPGLTQHGIVIGTIDYLPPEQATNARGVDRRADLYALGCTLYYLLAGRVPFPG